MSSGTRVRVLSQSIVGWYRDWLDRLEKTARAHGLDYSPQLLPLDSGGTAEGLLEHSAAVLKWYNELGNGNIVELRQLMRELELMRAVVERFRRGDC